MKNPILSNMGVELIILFGSQAAKTASGQSDTDVAVLADHPLDVKGKSDIAEIIAEEMHISEDDIDLVDLWDSSPLLQHEVAEKGTLLFGDPFSFTRFRVLAWKRYLDSAKFRRAREQSLQQYAQRTR